MSKLRTSTGWISNAAKQYGNSLVSGVKETIGDVKWAAGKVGGAIKNTLRKTWDIETKKKQNQQWQSDARKKVLERDKGEKDLNN